VSPYLTIQSADCTNTAAGTWAGNYDYPTAGTWAGDSDSPSTAAGTIYPSTYYFHVNIYGSCPEPVSVSPGEPTPVREETEGERQTRLEQQREAQRRYQESAKRREEAAKRAEELLKEHIGLEAFGRLHKVGYIEVDSHRHKGRKYRIPKESGFIDVIDENGKIIDTLCVHPAVECPPGDHILAQVILLQLDEDYILERANSHGP